jgi:hypothetical protein
MILTRRALLVATLSSFGAPAEAASRNAVSQSPPRGTSVRYIMPASAGSANGDSWANAASILQLNDMIAAAGPGGTVYIRADTGSYSITNLRVGISNGGQIGSPVTIMGVDGRLAPMRAVFVGNRTAWTLPTDPEAVTNVRN